MSDVVYIGIIHTHHLQVGLLFLNAGKNVLCEKPFAMNVREVRKLIAAARENNVFLMEVNAAERPDLVQRTTEVQKLFYKYLNTFEVPV